jgi:hypothetical protein
MKILIGLLLLLFLQIAKASTFTINAPETYTTEQRKQTLESYFTEIYKAVNIAPQFVYLPSLRGLDLVNKGEFDAEAARFELVGTPYPNLIKLNTPIAIVQSGFFCINEKNCHDKKKATIGVQKGFESAKLFCQTMLATCHFDSSPQSLAKLLESKMLASVFMTHEEAAQIICQLSVKKIFYTHQPNYDQPTYHWLHNRHKNLVPGLEKAISKVNKQLAQNLNSESWLTVIKACGKDVQKAS